ncbi:Hsp33 family molecular chaperone HslO [Haloplasma contractile]|uniref:33 kDa chaperonin n=1 Tax=Haloplasma contractile SSD-17B TaxID=1033810 RepID=U2FMQ4_9MOLU|nr:Hsp33 family molecular chaperone HslO [Haloplasma contractile]ERJ12429.1 33 kDa chaperonin protein [Haloplasma contractile SSD-17B]
MNDYIVKSLAFNDTIRILACTATETVNRAWENQHTYPTATAALGRTLIVGSMMGSMLKGEENITIRIKGDGPIGLITVDANARGEVRGYVENPLVHYQYDNGKLNVAKAVGKNGEIHVIKDLKMRDYFHSSVPIISGELGEDFTYYFTRSEQTPSSVGCGVLVEPDNSVSAAGGFIIQVMPGATEETIKKIETNLGKIKSVSSMVADGYTPEDIVKEICQNEGYRILDQMQIAYTCKCSKERFAAGLISLGKNELTTIIEEDGQAETECHFCKDKYHFDREELIALLEEAKA